MIKFFTVLSVLMTFLFCSAQPGIVHFHRKVNNKTTNCPEKDSDVRLICKTNGTASRMIIKRERDQKLLYTSPRASTSAEFLIENVQCVDMGVYQCIIDDIHMETIVLVLPECPPQPCHQEGTTMSVYAGVNEPLDIYLCVLVYGGILNYIEINNVTVRRKASVNDTWSWDSTENQKTSACFRNVIIALKHRNWTAEGYETMSVRVYSLAGNTFYLDYNISMIAPAQHGIVDFHPKINNQRTNCPENDSDVRLICKTNGIASRMMIIRAHDQKLLYSSPRASTSAEFLIEHVQCVDMGVYQCVIDNRHMETTTLVISECPPLPCHQEGTTMSVYGDVNKPLDISLCVLVYPGILNYTRINNVTVRRKSSPNDTWSWDYYENKTTPACFRNVTIVLKHENFTAEDYGTTSFRVYNSASHTFYLDYNISVIPPGSRAEIKEDNEVQKDNEAQEDNKVQEDIITFLPPFLVIAGAVVLTIVMIVRKEKMKKQKQQTV